MMVWRQLVPLARSVAGLPTASDLVMGGAPSLSRRLSFSARLAAAELTTTPPSTVADGQRESVYFVLQPRALAQLMKQLSDESASGSGSESTPVSGGGGGGDAAAAAEDSAASATTEAATAPVEDDGPEDILPHAVVAELDRYIVGQQAAKRSVAIALRNRWRRMRVSESLRSEIIPKNILMVGPTGCGKTEIARRLARLCQAPFIKVEATKYTEVGFHGKDVDTIIKDLMDVGIKNAKERAKKRNAARVQHIVEQKLLGLLLHPNNLDKQGFLEALRNGDLDDEIVSVDAPDSSNGAGSLQFPGGAGDGDGPQIIAMPGSPDIVNALKNLGRITGSFGAGDHRSSEKRKMPIREARKLLTNAEHDKLLKDTDLVAEAVRAVEESGIVFIDEIDKICQDRFAMHRGASASDEGVQRDLLPLIEGCSVSTKYGQIDTSRILFIASGAFHSCKPSDLLAELQGRLPIRVELAPLTEQDLYKILTDCENSLIKQQQALLAAEDIHLEVTDAAIRKICAIAIEVNTHVMNIGARRLHTIIEKITEDISYNCHLHKGKTVVIDAPQVEESVKELRTKIDLRKFML